METHIQRGWHMLSKWLICLNWCVRMLRHTQTHTHTFSYSLIGQFCFDWKKTQIQQMFKCWAFLHHVEICGKRQGELLITCKGRQWRDQIKELITSVWMAGFFVGWVGKWKRKQVQCIDHFFLSPPFKSVCGWLKKKKKRKPAGLKPLFHHCWEQ